MKYKPAPEPLLQDAFNKSVYLVPAKDNVPAICGYAKCRSPFPRGHPLPTICRVCFNHNLLGNDEKDDAFRRKMLEWYTANPSMTVRHALTILYPLPSASQAPQHANTATFQAPQAQLTNTQGGDFGGNQMSLSKVYAAVTQGLKFPSNESAPVEMQGINARSTSCNPASLAAPVAQQRFNQASPSETVYYSVLPFGASGNPANTLLYQAFTPESTRMRGQETRLVTQTATHAQQLPFGELSAGLRQGGPAPIVPTSQSQRHDWQTVNPRALGQRRQRALQRPGAEAAYPTGGGSGRQMNDYIPGWVDSAPRQSPAGAFLAQPAPPFRQSPLDQGSHNSIDPRLRQDNSGAGLLPPGSLLPTTNQPYTSVCQRAAPRDAQDEDGGGAAPARNDDNYGDGPGPAIEEQNTAEKPGNDMTDEECLKYANAQTGWDFDKSDASG